MGQNLPVSQTEKSLTKNKVVLPAALLLAGGVLGVIFTHFTLFSLLVAAFGAVLFFTKNIVKKSIELSSGPADRPLDEMLKTVRHEVSQTKYLKRQSKLGEKAAAHAVHLEASYQFLHKLLSTKFNPTEITYDRYEKAINEAVFKVSDNLRHLGQVITLLDHQDPPSPAALTEVQELLQLNQETLTGLDALAEALKGINRGEPVKREFEETLEKLQQLAARAQAYSTNTKE